MWVGGSVGGAVAAGRGGGGVAVDVGQTLGRRWADLGQTLGRRWVFGRAIPGSFLWILGGFSENKSARWFCRYKMVDFTIRKQHLGGSCQIGVPSGPSERKNLDSKCSYKIFTPSHRSEPKISTKNLPKFYRNHGERPRYEALEVAS